MSLSFQNLWSSCPPTGYNLCYAQLAFQHLCHVASITSHSLLLSLNRSCFQAKKPQSFAVLLFRDVAFALSHLL